MKRLYLSNTAMTFTGNEELLQLLQSVLAVTPITVYQGEITSCTVPTDKPTNRTKDYYTEQILRNALTMAPIAMIRDGKLETLNKTQHPFITDTPIELDVPKEPPTPGLREGKRGPYKILCPKCGYRSVATKRCPKCEAPRR